MSRDLAAAGEKVCRSCRRIKKRREFRAAAPFLGGQHPVCEACLVLGLAKDEAGRS